MSKPISIQLYSLRDQAAQDFPGVLRKLAEIGYMGVEPAGLHGHDPKEIGKLIKDLGLTVSSSHGPLPTDENINELIDTESTIGNTRIISGFGPDDFKTVDDCKRIAEKFAKANELVKPHGMSFGFHNHWWEFTTVGWQRVYDILMAEAPDVFSELDIYWVTYGKANPVEVINQYKSRLPILHIKDGVIGGEGPVFLPSGYGDVNIARAIGAADPNVLEWLVVEIDSYAGDMWDAVTDSYKFLTSNGLAKGNK